jgi:intraflagellar transport protein 172
MWQQLSDVALQHGDVIIAERCAAALGDVPRAAYLHAINATVSAIDKENNTDGNSSGDSRSRDHWSVRYKMCLLRKDMRGAEDVLMSQGKLQEALDMYYKVCDVRFTHCY